MGLSGTASRRRPHVLVMAPALTDSGQTQSFSPLNLFDPCDINFKAKPIGKEYRAKIARTVDEPLKGPNGTASKRCSPLRPLDVVPKIGDLSMNGCASMGDHPDAMGMLKTNGTCPLPDQPILKINEVEEMLKQAPPNVEELMQVFHDIGSGLPDSVEYADLLISSEEVIAEMDIDPPPESESLQDRVASVSEDTYRRHYELLRQESRLWRRLKKLEAREACKSGASEVKSVLNETCRLARTESSAEVTTPDSVELATFADNMRSALYATNHQVRSRTGLRYFGSGSMEYSPLPESAASSICRHPRLPAADCDAITSVCGQLHSKLKQINTQYDSDATDSSSGGESCDETANPYPTLTSSNASRPTRKQAYWRWMQDRGAIASRWSWLSARITDLDFRIRNLNDYTRKLRFSKGPVVLEEEKVAPSPSSVNGYHGPLPGAVKSQDATCPNGTVPAGYDPAGSCTSARTRPLLTRVFKKRHLFRTEMLHARGPTRTTPPATVRCWCAPGTELCLVCVGRTEPTQPAGYPPLGNPTIPERVAALDPSYHPVISLDNEIPLSLHLDSVMRHNEWQALVSRSPALHVPRKYKKYKYFDKKTNNADRLKKQKHKNKLHRHAADLLSAKLLKRKLARKEKRRKERSLRQAPIPPLKIMKAKKIFPGDSGEEGDLYVAAPVVDPGRAASPVSHASSTTGDETRRPRLMRNSEDSYDINNIVIPYSMAASTRLETIPYKEIPTPKWRLVEDIAESHTVMDDDTEDMGEETLMERHARSEEAERKRFMSFIKLPMVGRPRGARRTDSRADSSGTNTPDAMSPMPLDHHDALATPPATPVAHDDVPLRRRTISNSRVRFEHERAGSPEDETEVPGYEPRTFPLGGSELQQMLSVMPDDGLSNCHNPASSPPPPNGAPTHAFNSERQYESPSSSETVSAMDEVEEEDPDDPNDPDWRDDVDDEDFFPGM